MTVICDNLDVTDNEQAIELSIQRHHYWNAVQPHFLKLYQNMFFLLIARIVSDYQKGVY